MLSVSFLSRPRIIVSFDASADGYTYEISPLACTKQILTSLMSLIACRIVVNFSPSFSSSKGFCAKSFFSFAVAEFGSRVDYKRKTILQLADISRVQSLNNN